MPRKNQNQTATVDQTATETTTNKESETMNTAEQTAVEQTAVEMTVTIKQSNAYTKGLESQIQSWNIQALSVKIPDGDLRDMFKPMILPTLNGIFDNDKIKHSESLLRMIGAFNAQWDGILKIDLSPVTLELLARKDWKNVKSELIPAELQVFKVSFVVTGEVETEETEETEETGVLAFTAENIAKVLVENFGIDGGIAEEYAEKIVGKPDDNDLILVVSQTVDYKAKDVRLVPYNLVTYADVKTKNGLNALASRLSVFGGTAAEHAKLLKEKVSAKTAKEKADDLVNSL